MNQLPGNGDNTVEGSSINRYITWKRKIRDVVICFAAWSSVLMAMLYIELMKKLVVKYNYGKDT